MVHSLLPDQERALPPHLGIQLWAILTAPFRMHHPDASREKGPALLVNATAYAPDANNDLYPSQERNVPLQAINSPMLELIEMEMRIRLKWLSD